MNITPTIIDPPVAKSRLCLARGEFERTITDYYNDLGTTSDKATDEERNAFFKSLRPAYSFKSELLRGYLASSEFLEAQICGRIEYFVFPNEAGAVKAFIFFEDEQDALIFDLWQGRS
ncbi:hypothetical protein [uncultured Sphingomonas sp.]|uniref:hypothetical protein n=1 Tax=uncultured Sphingomonas sp. TaxID=158754 RepID=UPI0025E11F08|nr:hypothetical protein [uncultured Sphingomonas sp.]